MLRRIIEIGQIHRRYLISSLIAMTVSFQAKSTKLQTSQKYQDIYDLAVIGGGSGGLSTALQASKYGLRTIVIDYVEQTPAPHRTVWGLGGTCVNVGCIPKKLLYQAAKHGKNIIASSDYGWKLPANINEFSKEKQLRIHFKWEDLIGNVTNYIKSLNFGYLGSINSDKDLDYLNAMATFVDRETILCSKDPAFIRSFVKQQKVPAEGEYFIIKAKNFVIATGTRPRYLKCTGSQLAITSDDLFYKKKPPGSTLVVGGGFVAVQIAGFLKGLGYDVTLMTRDIYLRTFDRQMVNEVVENLKENNVNIIQNSLPCYLQNTSNNQIKVKIQNQNTKKVDDNIFDTVLFAIGRQARTQILNLDIIGVSVSQNNKIITSKHDKQKTTAPNIYAIGDVVEGLPQLTSTAVKMGRNLGRRIANIVKGISFPKNKMYTDLSNYPVAIFTPLQYACCGVSQEQAIIQYGTDVQVYRLKYYALEEQILDRYDQQGNNHKILNFSKLIVRKSDDKILGIHYAGPNAGQIMQGFAVAIRAGITKKMLDDTIGIHPTAAQNLIQMSITKQSGLPFEITSC